MAQIKVVLDTRRALKNGEYPVKIRVYHNGLIYFPTNATALKEDWADKVLPSDPRHKIKNARINNKLSNVEKEILPLEMSGQIGKYTSKQLKKIIDGNTIAEVRSIEPFFEEFIASRKAPRTKEIYQLTLDKVMGYDPTVLIDDIDVKWLTAFDEELKVNHKNGLNARAIHMRNIRAVFNYCLDNDMVANYPFRKFKIKTEKTAKRSLPINRLRELIHTDLTDLQERARDFFMLSFYLLGINMVDLLHLKHSDFINGRIEFHRAKTNRLYSIKVFDEAKAIINKYKGQEFLLDVMDNYSRHQNFLKTVNSNLKKIGEVEVVGTKGKKKINAAFPELSTYWARHTWATLAGELDVTKETISHALGHGNNTVTDVYIDFNLKKVDEANRRVIDYVLELDKKTLKPS